MIGKISSNRLFTILGMLVLFSAAILYYGCSDEKQANISAPESGPMASLSKTLGTGDFNFWSTCGAMPYIHSDGIVVPVGNCSTSINAAQQKTGQTAQAFYFYGCFKGGSSAYSSASEEAVFVCDNVTEWNGNEMGFVKTLNDNTLKAYLQGGGQYIYRTISVNDNGYHAFKCAAQPGDTHKVDFYVDEVYQFTLTNNSGYYYNRWYYFVGTNHWYGGTNPTGQQIEMYNMNIW
jgi:hypothetical protein